MLLVQGHLYYLCRSDVSKYNVNVIATYVMCIIEVEKGISLKLVDVTCRNILVVYVVHLSFNRLSYRKLR